MHTQGTICELLSMLLRRCGGRAVVGHILIYIRISKLWYRWYHPYWDVCDKMNNDHHDQVETVTLRAGDPGEREPQGLSLEALLEGAITPNLKHMCRARDDGVYISVCFMACGENHLPFMARLRDTHLVTSCICYFSVLYMLALTISNLLYFVYMGAEGERIFSSLVCLLFLMFVVFVFVLLNLFVEGTWLGEPRMTFFHDLVTVVSSLTPNKSTTKKKHLADNRQLCSSLTYSSMIASQFLITNWV